MAKSSSASLGEGNIWTEHIENNDMLDEIQRQMPVAYDAAGKFCEFTDWDRDTYTVSKKEFLTLMHVLFDNKGLLLGKEA